MIKNQAAGRRRPLRNWRGHLFDAYSHGLAGQQIAPEKPAVTSTLSGAQVYAINCSRCHQERYPTEFDLARWKTIMTHMRVRANLPAPRRACKMIEFQITISSAQFSFGSIPRTVPRIGQPRFRQGWYQQSQTKLRSTPRHTSSGLAISRWPHRTIW
jgi:hypothetical protein